MPITFTCSCAKTLRVPDASAGKKAKCPACGALVTIPEPEPVFEVVIPPLPPDPSEGVEPAADPDVGQVALPPLGGGTYGKPRYDEDDEDDKTPYGLAAGENDKRSGDLDHEGNPRKKDGLPNFNKGKKKYNT